MTENDPLETRLVSALRSPITTSQAATLDARLRAAREPRGAGAPTTQRIGRTAALVVPDKAPHAHRRRGRIAAGLLVAAVLAVTSVVAAQRVLYPDRPYPALEAALAEVFASTDCVSPGDARDAVRSRLDSLGYADWTIEAREGVKGAPCVSAAIVAPHHVVALLPAAGGELIRAMDAVREELMRRCLGRDDAMELVRSALVSIGVDDTWRVRADPQGPQGWPIDEGDAYRRHVAADCYVLAGMPNYGFVDLWGP